MMVSLFDVRGRSITIDTVPAVANRGTGSEVPTGGKNVRALLGGGVQGDVLEFTPDDAEAFAYALIGMAEVIRVQQERKRI